MIVSPWPNRILKLVLRWLLGGGGRQGARGWRSAEVFPQVALRHRRLARAARRCLLAYNVVHEGCAIRRVAIDVRLLALQDHAASAPTRRFEELHHA